MAQRNRTSSQKRDRERRKTEKAEHKRDRRQQRKDGTLPVGDYGITEDEGTPAEDSSLPNEPVVVDPTTP